MRRSEKWYKDKKEKSITLLYDKNNILPLDKEKSIGISFGYPYVHYDVMGNAPTFVNAYCNTKPVMSALTKALYGEIPFEGVSPVDLDNCAMY